MINNASDPPIPLLHDSDVYEIYVETLSPTLVLLRQIVRYQNNTNSNGVQTNFHDLLPEAKRAIIQQINRRYIGRSVRV